MYYVGLKKGARMEVFQSATKPTTREYGHKYLAYSGPYKKKARAHAAILLWKLIPPHGFV